jgi:YceI-like domain
LTRYRIAPERSHVWIEARSNVHPIRSSTDGLEGFVELSFGSDGEVDPSAAPSGKMSLPVSRLSSGKAMEDREMQRRVDARRFPTIDGTLCSIKPTGGDHVYLVKGDVSFKGVVRPHEDQMTIESAGDEEIKLQGSSQFDIREFGMEPPKILLLRVLPEVDVRVEIVALKEG